MNNEATEAKAKVCGFCNGRGTEADYVGLEMRCVEAECPYCNGSGIDHSSRLPAREEPSKRLICECRHPGTRHWTNSTNGEKGCLDCHCSGFFPLNSELAPSPIPSVIEEICDGDEVCDHKRCWDAARERVRLQILSSTHERHPKLKERYEARKLAANASAGKDVKLPPRPAEIQQMFDSANDPSDWIEAYKAESDWHERQLLASLKENASLKADHHKFVISVDEHTVRRQKERDLGLERAEQAEAALALRDEEIARLNGLIHFLHRQGKQDDQGDMHWHFCLSKHHSSMDSALSNWQQAEIVRLKGK